MVVSSIVLVKFVQNKGWQPPAWVVSVLCEKAIVADADASKTTIFAFTGAHLQEHHKE
jgi:hypothetical protein